MDTKVGFRSATREDCHKILEFINELAIYENMADQVQATPSALEKWLFDQKRAEVIFVMEGLKEVGFALYFHTFSTFKAKPGIYLEDLFVLAPYRHRGYGKGLFKELARLAKQQGCGRIEWSCLDWNQSSINFYKSLNARQLGEWLTFRLEETDYEKLI